MERVYAGQTIGGDAVAGTFSVPFTIYWPDGILTRCWDGVVDPHRLYSIIPRQFFEELGVPRDHCQRFRRKDGLVKQVGIGSVRMELDGKTSHNQVVFGDDLHETVIGSITVTVSALASDPERKRLVLGLITL